ncbi:MAG: hypothetical protein HY532_07325, partial [Chloroflexi bacterium]|nr:hypothetical protein [Chloroflexota bacterium]
MSLKVRFPRTGRLRLPLALCLALLAIACTARRGQEEATPTPTRAPEIGAEQVVEAFASVTISEIGQRRLSRIDIVPRHALVPAGETAVLVVIAYDDAGNGIRPEELEVRWQMTDPLAGEISRTGVLHASLQRGVFNRAIEVSVSQEVGGRLVTLQGLASISVIRPLSENDISTVEVLPRELQIEPGVRVDLTALALDRARVPVPGVDFSWEMLNTEAGNVDTDGHFTSSKQEGSYPGAIRVVAKKRGDPTQTAAATVTVAVRKPEGAQPPTKVNLYPQAVSLRSGDIMEFRALALDQRGNLF